MLAFIALFFPAALMVIWKRKLSGEEYDWKMMALEYVTSVLVLNLIVVAIAYIFFGSRGGIVYNINTYVGFAMKYIFLSSLLALALPWICLKTNRIGRLRNYISKWNILETSEKTSASTEQAHRIDYDEKQNFSSVILCFLGKIHVKDILIFILILFAAILFCMNSPLNFLVSNGTAATDSSVFKTVALYMERGLMPYKDIFDHKGPLIYIYNWLGIQIEYYRGVWIIEVLSMFVSFYVIYLTARLFCNRASSLAVLFISVTPLFTYFGSGGGNMTEEYAIPFIAIALFIFIDFFIFGNITKIRLLLCGFCFGAVLLLRPNMIAVWIVFCIAVLIKTITCRDYKSLLNYLLFFIIGAGIILIPVSLWLMMNGAFDDMIQAYIIFNIEYVSSEVRATWEDRYVSFMKFFNTTFYMAAFITALFLAKKRKDLFHFSYVAYLILSLLLICMSGMTYNHYGMILVPAEVYSFSMIMSKIESIKKEKWLGMAFVGLFMIENVLPSWISLSSTAVGYIENMGVTERTDKVGQTVEVVEQYTDEDDLITVFGNWNIIYVLTERLSASKYSYQSPLIKIDTDMADEYFEDLENNTPSLIIMGTSFVEGDDAYGRMMDFIEEYNYELLTDEIKDTTIYIQSD